MTKKLIALVDGSIYARSVCDHAAWIAGRTGLEVELIHVLGRREAGSTADLSGAIALGARSTLLAELAGLDEQRARLATQKGRAILEDAKAILDAAAVPAVEHLRRGDLVDAIAERATDAAMIVVGKRGEAADFAKGHLGSNLDRVIRSSELPLYVATRAFHPVGKVLVAFDGSASAVRAVEFVAKSPLFQGLAVTIVTVSSDGRAGDSLADAAARLTSAGYSAEMKVVAGHPEEALAQLIATDGFDQIVMGRSGHGRLRRMFVGSTSLEMIRVSKIPALFVR